MKKRLTVFTALLLALTCLVMCSCSKTDRNLNKMVKKSYDYVSLTITTDIEGVILTSVYTATKTENNQTQIRFSYQTFNTIDVSNGSITLPEGRITTYRGTLTVDVNRNNAVVKSSGDEIDINLKEVTAKNVKFDSKNFTDIKDNDGFFSAKINDLSRFMGTSVKGSDGTVQVRYLDGSLVSMVISYINEQGSVITADYSYQQEN